MNSTRAGIVLAAGICACAGDARAQGSVAEDRAALIAFHDAVDVQEWQDDENWASDAPLGEWSRVTTDESGRVTKLEVLLFGFGTVPVPAVLGNLTKLEVLDLSGLSTIGAPIPMLHGSIPAEFGKLTMLKELDLGFNDLSGPIPAELANLTKLEKLILGDDWGGSGGLDGPVPAWLGNLTQLKVLNLGGNALSGPIPAGLGSLTQLEVLNLGGNALSGPIPAELGNLSALEHLNLVGNRLSGAIPVAFGSLTGLESLDLARNALSGSIPAGLGNLTNLKSLDLAGNELGGSIPDALWNLTDLVVLDLHGNALSGPIPVALGELARLERVYFSSNRLSGPFPAVVARLPELERMEFASNQWSGPLPGDVWKLANLEVLHSRRGQLRDATDVGTVRFAGEAGQLVAVTARSHGSAAQLRLRSSAGERIALAGPYGDEFQLARLPSDGEYRIDVLTRRGFGDYEVTVRAVPLEPLTMGSSVDTFLAAGLGVRAWRFRGAAGQFVSVDARIAYRMRTGAHALFLLSRDGERLGRISTDHYKTWTLNARLPRTEDYVLVYAYTHEYENYGVRMAVRASDPELR